ncbi:MAG: DUF2309 family protein [Gammaproteobacteria bacterium]|nr:DUF2309 family protein [Gammaproteobacteria bacterium]
MIYVAAEPVPYFWPMRAFIHHNPLHGLEDYPFQDAVKKGASLFHGQTYLPRSLYQQYLAQGRIDHERLQQEVARFLAERAAIPGVNLQEMLLTLLTRVDAPVMLPTKLAGDADIHAAWQGRPLPAASQPEPEVVADRLQHALLKEKTMYEAVDALYGTEIGASLDELVIKSCLDFFDEGQSVWRMPNREQGFFAAWRQVARRNIRLFLRGLHIHEILAVDDSPEGVIDYVMKTLQVPEDEWVNFFTRELARLHGWAGFIRWRANAKHYHWAQHYPGDLVDYMAVRLTLALALLSERGRQHIAHTSAAISELITSRTQEAYLRYELYGGAVLPARAHQIEMALLRRNARKIQQVYAEYIAQKRDDEAQRQGARLRSLLAQSATAEALAALSSGQFADLLAMLRDFEQQEGMCWLRAMESHAMRHLLQGINTTPPEAREKRPFVQALFCIDTRSERIRRQLETIGDYQTFGIAGFFGVPVSFMELGKGSETHLCPVLLTPKNVVLEMSMHGGQEPAALGALEKAIHALKESILTPFVTVEAIGLLFGFDMVGKTIAPRAYNRWRHRLHPQKPVTRLLLDKLTREQADSIVRAVQRAVIVKAMELELGLSTERLTDELIRDLRESAMEHDESYRRHAQELGVSEEQLEKFIGRLRAGYRINPAFAQLQMERLGRIGFSLDEQVRFVSQALKSIGLKDGFSRFILLVGHGSASENNPYESALDCGACGGNHGLVSARVLAQMANKADVRQRLNESGIHIPDDAWFVPALHNTTTDEITVQDLDLMPSSHLVYLDRLRKGLTAASRLCAQERLPSLQLEHTTQEKPAAALRFMQRNSLDWSQVRPEWGLSGNAYFIIGNRNLTRQLSLEGRAFLHSYDYRVDKRRRLLENILTGPLVVGQWINMEHYFSAVDNERFGSGSKVYHNVAGRFGVMTGNLSDLRTGLPAQTVHENGKPYHQPLRLITVIEAPFEHAFKAVEAVVSVKYLVRNGWIRLMIVDPETQTVFIYEDGDWHKQSCAGEFNTAISEEACAS